MPKVLVTGGCGYIGSHTIIELLAQTDFEVISLDNLSNSSLVTMQRIEQISGKKVENLTVDLCNSQELEKVFVEHQDIIGIIHFAAFKSVPESVSNPLLYYYNNLNSLINLLQCCNKYSIKNFIFSSSCSVYGNVTKLPVDENSVLEKAESPYAYTKQIGEVMLKDFVQNNDVQAIALRYFNPVGAHKSGLNGENPNNIPSNLVPVITRTAAGLQTSLKVFGVDYDTRDGSCVRDYIHVSDIANAHILALQLLLDKKNASNFDIFNLGTGQGVTVLEAIKAFEKVSGIKPNYTLEERRMGDVAAIYSDNTKSETVLGWKPQFMIEEMMETAWKWQQNIL